VRWVAGSEFAALENIDDRIAAEKLIRIDFSSETDVTGDTGNLYVHGDFCPMQDETDFSVWGPYPDGRSLFGDGANPVRRPIRDAAGRYHYVAYLRVAAPGYQFSDAYDLRRGARDLCFRIDSPGYYITPSRSRVFVLPAAEVERLLRET
jgi:hypothetical protein